MECKVLPVKINGILQQIPYRSFIGKKLEVSKKDVIGLLEKINQTVNYGFKLSIDKTGKDQGKANYANAYIGLGVPNRKSSTEIYLEDAKKQGIPVNDEIVPNKNTVAFVSVASEGTRVEETFELVKRVLDAGGTIIMDRSGTEFGQSHSSYNVKGEGRLQDMIREKYGEPKQTKEGYNYWGSDIEKQKPNSINSKVVEFINTKFKDQSNVPVRLIIARLTRLYFPKKAITTILVDENKTLKEKLDALSGLFQLLDGSKNNTKEQQEYLDTIYSLLSLDYVEDEGVEKIKKELVSTEEITVNSKKEFVEALNKIQKELEDKSNKTFVVNIKFDDSGEAYQEYKKLVNSGKIKEAFVDFKIYDKLVDKSTIDKNKKLSTKTETLVEGTGIRIIYETPAFEKTDDENIKRTEYIAEKFAVKISEKLEEFKYNTVLIGEYNTAISVKNIFQNLFIRYLFHLNENDYNKIVDYYEFDDVAKEKFKSIMVKVSDYLKSDKLHSDKQTLYELLEFLNEKNISFLNLITTIIEVLSNVNLEENEEGYISYRIVKNMFFDGLLKNNTGLINSIMFKILRDESVSKLKENKQNSNNQTLSENIVAIVDKYVQEEEEFQTIRNNIRELLNLKHPDIEDAFVDMLKMFLSTSLYYSIYGEGINEESINKIINTSFGIMASALKKTISEFLFAGHYQDMDIPKDTLGEDSDLTLEDEEVYEANGENDDAFITSTKLENKELNDIGAINFVMLTFVSQMLGPDSGNIDVVDLYNGLVIKLKTFLLDDTVPLYFDTDDINLTSSSLAANESNTVFKDYLEYLNRENKNKIKSRNLVDYLPFIYFTKQQLFSIKTSNDLEGIISAKSNSELKIERTVFHRLNRKMETIYPVTNIDYEVNTKDLMVLLPVRDSMTISHYARVTNKKMFQSKGKNNRIGPSNVGKYLVYKGYLKSNTVATLNNVIDGKDSKLVESTMTQLLNDNIPKNINKYALINQFTRMLYLVGADLNNIDLNGYIEDTDKDMYKVIKDLLVKSSNEFKELYKDKKWDEIKNNILFKLSYLILNEVDNLDLSEVRGFESILTYINNLDGFSFSDVLSFAKMLSEGFENLYKFYDAKGITNIREFVGYYNAVTNYDISSDGTSTLNCVSIRSTYVKTAKKDMLTSAQTKLTRVMFSVIDDYLLTFLKMKIDTYKGTSRQERSYPNKGLANTVVVTAVDKKIYDKGYFAYLFEKVKTSNSVDNVNVISFRNELIKGSSMLRPLLNIKLFHTFGTVYTVGAGVKKTQLSLGFSSSVYQYYSPNKKFGVNPSMGISEVIERDIEDKYKDFIVDAISTRTESIDKEKIRKFIEIVYSKKKVFNYNYVMKMLKTMVSTNKDIRGQRLIDAFKMLLVHDTMDPLMILIHPLFENNNWFVDEGNNYFTGEKQLNLFTDKEYKSIINALRNFYKDEMKIHLGKSNGYQYFSLYYSLLTFVHAEISARLEYEKLVGKGSKDLKIPKSYYDGVYLEASQTFTDIPVFKAIANEIFSGKGYDDQTYKDFYNFIKKTIDNIYQDIKGEGADNSYIIENISFDEFYRLLNEIAIKDKSKNYLADMFEETMNHLSGKIEIDKNNVKTIFEIDIEKKFNNTEMASLYNDILNRINLLKTLNNTNNIRTKELIEEIKNKLKDLNSFLPIELYTNDEIIYHNVLASSGYNQPPIDQQKVLNTLIEKHNSNKHDPIVNTITKIRRAVSGLLSFDFESPFTIISIVPRFVNEGKTDNGIFVNENEDVFDDIEVLENTLNILKGVILEYHNHYVNGIISPISTYAQYSMISNVIYTETGNLKRSNALTSPGVKPSYDNVVVASDLTETQKVLSNIQTQGGLKTLETKDTIIDLTQLDPIKSLLEEVEKDYEIRRKYITDKKLLEKYDEKYRSLVKAYKEANHTDGFCMAEIHTAYLTLKALGYDTSGVLDKMMLYVNSIDRVLLDENYSDEEKIRQYVKLRNEFISTVSEDLTFNNHNFLGAIKMQYAGGKTVIDKDGNTKIVSRVLSNHKYTWYPIHPLLNATTIVSSYEELSHTEKEMLKLYTLMRKKEISYITSGEKINPVTKPSEVDDTVNNNKESIFYYSTENVNGRNVVKIHVNEKVFKSLNPTLIETDNLKLNSFYIDKVKEQIPLNVKLLNMFNSGEVIGVNDITFKLGYFYFYLKYLSAVGRTFAEENLDEQTNKILNQLIYANESAKKEWYSVNARKYFGTSYTQVVALEVLLPLAPKRISEDKEQRIKEVFDTISEINNKAVDELTVGKEVHFILTNDAVSKLSEVKAGESIAIVDNKKVHVIGVESINISEINPNNQLVKTEFKTIGDEVVIQNNFKIVSVVVKSFKTIDVVKELKDTLLDDIRLDDKDNIDKVYDSEQYKNLQGDIKEKNLQTFVIYNSEEIVNKSDYNIRNEQIKYTLNSLFASKLEKYNFLFFGYKILNNEGFETVRNLLIGNKTVLIDSVIKTSQNVYDKFVKEKKETDVNLSKIQSYFREVLDILVTGGYVNKNEKINELIESKKFTNEELELIDEILFNVLVSRIINFKYFNINNNIDYSFLNAAKQVISFKSNSEINKYNIKLLVEPSSNVLSRLQELYIIPDDNAVIFRRENVSWNSNYIPLLFLKHPDGKYVKTVERLNEALLDENFVKQNEKLLMIVGLRVPLQVTSSTQIIIPNQFLLFLSSVVQDSVLSTRIMGNDYDDDKLVVVIPEKKVILKDKKGKTIRTYGLNKLKNRKTFEDVLSKIDSGKYDVEVVYGDGVIEKTIDTRYRYEKTGLNFKHIYQMVEKGTNYDLAKTIYDAINKDSENSGVSYTQQTRKTALQKDVTTRIGNVVYLQALQDISSIKIDESVAKSLNLISRSITRHHKGYLTLNSLAFRDSLNEFVTMTVDASKDPEGSAIDPILTSPLLTIFGFLVDSYYKEFIEVLNKELKDSGANYEIVDDEVTKEQAILETHKALSSISVILSYYYNLYNADSSNKENLDYGDVVKKILKDEFKFVKKDTKDEIIEKYKDKPLDELLKRLNKVLYSKLDMNEKKYDENPKEFISSFYIALYDMMNNRGILSNVSKDDTGLTLIEEQELLFAILNRISLLSDTILREVFDEEVIRALNHIISSRLNPNVIKAVNNAIMVTQVKDKFNINTTLIEGEYKKLSNSFYYPINDDRKLYGDTATNIVLLNSFDKLLFDINPSFWKVYGTYYSYYSNKTKELQNYELRKIILEDINLNFDKYKLEVLLKKIDDSKANFSKTIEKETNEQSEDVLTHIYKMLDNERIFNNVLSILIGVNNNDVRIELLRKIHEAYSSKKEMSDELKKAYVKITYFILIYYKHFVDTTNLNVKNTENPFNIYVHFLNNLLNVLSDEDVIEYANRLYNNVESFYEAMYMIAKESHKVIDEKTGKVRYKELEYKPFTNRDIYMKNNGLMFYTSAIDEEDQVKAFYINEGLRIYTQLLNAITGIMLNNTVAKYKIGDILMSNTKGTEEINKIKTKIADTTVNAVFLFRTMYRQYIKDMVANTLTRPIVGNVEVKQNFLGYFNEFIAPYRESLEKYLNLTGKDKEFYKELQNIIKNIATTSLKGVVKTDNKYKSIESTINNTEDDIDKNEQTSCE